MRVDRLLVQVCGIRIGQDVAGEEEEEQQEATQVEIDEVGRKVPPLALHQALAQRVLQQRLSPRLGLRLTLTKLIVCPS